MTPEELLIITADVFAVQRSAIMGDSRIARIAQARHAFAWGLRKQGWSLEEIGAYLGRDHTSIIYGLARIEQRAPAQLAVLKERIMEQSSQLAPADMVVANRELRTRVEELERLIDRYRKDLEEANTQLRLEQADATRVRSQVRGLVEQNQDLRDERRALCDVLSADVGTVAGQTLADAMRAIIAERDRLSREVLGYQREWARLEEERTGYLAKIERLTLALDGQTGRVEELERQLAEAQQQLTVMEESAAFQIGSGIINSARVSSDNAKPTITPLEETRGIVCPRCGNFLNNVSPGISVVAGGISICTPCLNPGETEIARARGL